ncbi:MAG: hypothetical protein IPK60_00125 [Sandaracinaceae bacterium]|nr:hypothetical protein [Sandaracinaceae bacterium]
MGLGEHHVEQDPQRVVHVATSQTQVRRSVVRSLQGALIQRGLWSELRARLASTNSALLRELDRTETQEWWSAESHLALLDGAAELVGLDGMHALGRERIRGIEAGALFPAIIGSWTRSFPNGADVVQVFPHLWRASSLNGGQLALKELGENHAIFHFEGCTRAICTSAPWLATIKGMALGLLDRVGLTGESRATVTQDGNSVEFYIAWSKQE